MTNENELPEAEVKRMPTESVDEREGADAVHLDAEMEVSDLSEEKSIDFTSYKKVDFVNLVKDLSKEDDFKKIDALLKEIKPLYDDIREHERKAALEKYLNDGGTKEDFEFRIDDLDHLYDATLKFIKDKRNAFYKSLEDRKNESLKHKNDILEKLRALVHGDDSPQAFHQFKDLQKEWKNSGPVAASHLKTLWANYNALIDRFYDHRNIYFELKELDRKKNLEAKKELCVRAEKLIEAKSLSAAVKELNELHHEFKHIGPVPQEEQESLWQRFKAASDAVYTRRDEFTANLLATLQQNEATKNLLNEEIIPFATFTSDRIKDWNQKTKDILELQKKWDAVGPAPRSHQRDLNKKFWASFKLFFHNKNVFFRKLDEERLKNLKIKEALVQRANELKDNQDWEKTSQELKLLQAQWKEVGPVPEKWREKIYQQFKDACDHFFGQRRGLQEKEDQDQEANLVAKEALLSELERIAEEKTGTLQQIKDIQTKLNALGFVPKRSVASVKARSSELINKAVASIANASENEKEQASMEMQLSSLKNDPDAERKLFQKEQTIRKQIAKAENDIAVLQNNLSFFDRAKNAEQMKAEYGEKIKIASDQLVHLKKQLKMLNQPVQGL